MVKFKTCGDAKNCRLSEKINETQKIHYEIILYGISELKISKKFLCAMTDFLGRINTQGFSNIMLIKT